MGFSIGGTLGFNKSKTSSNTQIDAELKPLRSNVLGQAMGLANQPIQQFQGDRVAGFDPNQTAAMGAMGSLGANGLPLAQKGFNILGGIGTADQRMGAYQNPYTDQVIDRSMQDICLLYPSPSPRDY